MVTARFLTEKFLEPQREKLRKPAREQGLSEGLEQGLAEGRGQDDPRPPRVTSGLRLGTPAITSRGMGSAEAGLVARVVRNVGDAGVLRAAAGEARELALGFPVPGVDG